MENLRDPLILFEDSRGNKVVVDIGGIRYHSARYIYTVSINHGDNARVNKRAGRAERNTQWHGSSRITVDRFVPFYTATSILSKRCEGNANPEGSNVIPARQVMAALSRGHCYLSDSGLGVTSLVDTIRWGQLKNYGIRGRICSDANDTS